MLAWRECNLFRDYGIPLSTIKADSLNLIFAEVRNRRSSENDQVGPPGCRDAGASATNCAPFDLFAEQDDRRPSFKTVYKSEEYPKVVHGTRSRMLISILQSAHNLGVSRRVDLGYHNVPKCG